MFRKRCIDSLTSKVVFLSEGEKTIEISMRSGKILSKFTVPKEREDPYFISPDRSLRIVRRISSEIVGRDPLQISSLDEFLHLLDGTENMSRIGRNVSTGISISNILLSSKIRNVEPYEMVCEHFGRKAKIPKILVTLCEGQKDGLFPFRELFLISEIKNFWNVLSVFKSFRSEIREKYGRSYIFPGRIGGYYINIKDPTDVLLILSRILEEGGYKVEIGIDFNAEGYYFDGRYKILEGLTTQGYVEYIRELLKTFRRIRMVLDPLHRRDIYEIIEIRKVGGGLKILTKKAAISERFDGILSYIYSFGTITNLSRKTNVLILSDNEYTTCEKAMVDIAVGLGIPYIKIGGLLGFDRISKYKRLLEISEKFKS